MNKNIYQFLNLFFSSKFKQISNLIEHDLSVFFKFCSTSVDCLNQKCSATDSSDFFCEKTYSFELFDPFLCDSRLSQPLLYMLDVVHRRGDLFNNILVHGSFASGDPCLGWSDFDALLILNDEVIIDHQLFKDAWHEVQLMNEKTLKNIDHLCHHEFQVLALSDLKKLPVSILPPIVFDTMKAVKKETYTVSFYGDLGDAKNTLLSYLDLFRNSLDTNIFEHHPVDGVYLAGKFARLDNSMYQFKYFISVVCLAPAIFYNSIGKELSKKDAIHRIQADYPNFDWTLLRSTTRLREMWPNKSNFPYLSKDIPNWVLGVVSPDYFQQAFKMFNFLVGKLNDES